MHKVADVTVAKNIMEANKKLADKNKERFGFLYRCGSYDTWFKSSIKF